MVDNNRSVMTQEDIIFEFEGFLEEHEENLPQGLDAQYMAYVPILEDPFRNLSRIPEALINLPLNAILHQSWKTIFSLFLIIAVLALPSFSFLVYTAYLVDRTGVGVSFVIIILLGILVAFSYMKYIYGSISNLMESRKAPWLVERINKQFNANYQRSWSKRILSISLFLPLIMETEMILVALTQLNFQVSLTWIIVWGLLLLIGHFGLALLIFVSLLSFQYIRINTKIYDLVLQPIIDRVRGYTEGHESILNKKNYEVVGVLSDTPGLSVQTLGDIPTFGLGSGIFSVNALIFLLVSPLLLWAPVEAFFFRLGNSYDPDGLRFVILAGIAISSIASFGAVVGPLIRITRVMGNFKTKALTELDPFLFDEITGVALRRDIEISNESQVLFMIRNYIYSMKTSPVNPFRLLQIVVLALLYGLRGLPYIIYIINLLGGAFHV